MEGRGGVGVDAVVCFDDEEAGGVGGGGADFGGNAAECAGVGSEGCGKAGGVEVGGVGTGLVHYAKIVEISEHLDLGFCQVRFAVGLAEFEAAEHEEEGKDVYGVHFKL